jgi:enhancing lycopene biosynthesis protein 2
LLRRVIDCAPTGKPIGSACFAGARLYRVTNNCAPTGNPIGSGCFAGARLYRVTNNKYLSLPGSKENLMKKFAVVLSGCGVSDGSEIHEATMTLLAIAQHGASYDIFAPDINQYHVINHLTHKVMPETRNVLVESARIARGKIRPLSQFSASEYDAIIFPGGFGAAKNLSTVAFDGANAKVNPDVEAAVKAMHRAGKPIGALCISPAVLTRILGGIEVTIGDDPGTISVIKKMGGVHIEATHGEVVVDKKNKIFTTPCYMLDATIMQVYEGARNVIIEILKSV